mmetsp:Transcript_7839/g.17550  ORF Transcript_7839/g.17550 Transcript_7839/m.17550 type:complete len:440 (-) Transcript_7839:1698-3017(-)
MGGYPSSPLYEDTPLGKPKMRLWELTSNSTRYDRARAAPSDEEMRTVWTVWSASFFVYATFNIIVFAGIAASRKTRRRPFNLYLLFLMIPDIMYTLFCAFQCAFLAANTGFVTPSDCQWQSFYLVFGLTANSWLNGVIAGELHRLLTFSGRRRRYFPPTLQKVTRNSLLVYAYSALLSAMGCIAYPWWPHRTDLLNGLVCMPMDFDTTSTILFWTLFVPFMSAIPLLYTLYVGFDVWRKGLLPPSGKRRELTIYFYKITGVFLLMWLPGVFIFYVLSGVTIWAIYAAPLWSHSQGAVAAGVSMMKKDIYDAVMDFVWCRSCKRCRGANDDGDDAEQAPSSLGSHLSLHERQLSDRAGLQRSVMNVWNNAQPATSDTVPDGDSHIDDDDDDIYSQGSSHKDPHDDKELGIIEEDRGEDDGVGEDRWRDEGEEGDKSDRRV